MQNMRCFLTFFPPIFSIIPQKKKNKNPTKINGSVEISLLVGDRQVQNLNRILDILVYLPASVYWECIYWQPNQSTEELREKIIFLIKKYRVHTLKYFRDISGRADPPIIGS